MTPRKKTIFVCLIYNGWMKLNDDARAGIMRYAKGHPEWVLKICNLQLANPSGVLRNFLSFRFDGIIGANVPERFILRQLPPEWRHTPRIAFAHNPQRDHADSIVHVDYDVIIASALQMFRRLGISNFACVGSSNLQIARTSRTFCRKMMGLIAPNEATFSKFLFSPASVDRRNPRPHEYERLGDWIAQLPKPCGILSCTDNNAKDVLDACRIRGIKVPEEVAVCGLGNNPRLCENTNPTLTSIDIDIEAAAFKAAALLDKMIHSHPPFPRRIIPCGVKEIVERESTQDRRGTGRIIALAREFIRTQACSGIGVPDVARHLNVSRRTLEQRFHDRLGSTVLDEILRVRLEQVQRLLQETDNSIKDITFSCGFRSEIALKPLFKRRFGMTMTAWRACHAHDHPTRNR